MNLTWVWGILDKYVAADIFIIFYFSASRHAVRVGCRVFFVRLDVRRTSLQDLLDLDVVCTEAAVELEVVRVVEEGTPERKQELL